MARFESKRFEAGMALLAEKYGRARVLKKAWRIAEQLLKWAQEKAPYGRYAGGGGLLGSSHVVILGFRVRFGFNKVYAAFQDAPGKTGNLLVQRRRKKMLYIPISDRGRKHVYGQNPEKEGLRRGVDYVLTKGPVKIPIKGYGSNKGPNHYFSETIKRKAQWALATVGKELFDDMRAAAEGRGGA